MTIFSQGGDALNREFKDLLFRHSKPMLPVNLLNIINIDDGNLIWFYLEFSIKNY